MWRTIGTELGIDADALNAIGKNDANDGSRLKAVINGANPAPTHEIMSKLLQSANVKSAIAGMIMFCPPPTTTTKQSIHMHTMLRVCVGV